MPRRTKRATVGAMSEDDGRALLAQLIAAKTGWIAKVPTEADAATIRKLADEPIEAARQTVLAVKLAFMGTIPPPPWPAGPELVAARDRVEAIRDGAEVMERKGVASPINARALTVLRDAGAKLYDQAMDLLKRYLAAPKLPDLLKLVPDPRNVLAGAPLYLLLLLGYVVWRARDR